MQHNLWLGPEWAASRKLYASWIHADKADKAPKAPKGVRRSRWCIGDASRATANHHMIGVCGELLAQLGQTKHVLELRPFFEQRIDPTYEQWASFEENLARFLLGLISRAPLSEYDPVWDALDELDDYEKQLFYRTVYYCSGYSAATLLRCDLV